MKDKELPDDVEKRIERLRKESEAEEERAWKYASPEYKRQMKQYEEEVKATWANASEIDKADPILTYDGKLITGELAQQIRDFMKVNGWLSKSSGALGKKDDE